MLMQTNGVFGPHELNSMQDLFDDAWAMLAKSRLLADAADEQTAKARLGRIVLRLYTVGGQRDGVRGAAISRFQITDIRGYLDPDCRTRSHSESSR